MTTKSTLQNRAIENTTLLKNLTEYQQLKTNTNNFDIKFYTSSQLLELELLDKVFKLTKMNMKSMYEKAWGWDEQAKIGELTDPMARFLVVFEKEKFVGFVHLRFELDLPEGSSTKRYELYIYEIQLKQQTRNKGLGSHLMKMIDLIAIENQVEYLVLTVFKVNPKAFEFYKTLNFKIEFDDPQYWILAKKISTQ